jgi:16S rRNA (adenine1518-N6/adenine1519-N6)-dimethyltransferase
MLGQHFLKNKNEIKKMVEALDAKPGDVIIEIGPGQGAVTRELVELYGGKDIRIVTVEVDSSLVEKLRKTFPNIEVVEEDILKWLWKFDPEARPIKIIGSLPYYITTPILQEIVRMPARPETCVLLVQKEVADKILQTPPESVPISVLVQTFFEVEGLGHIDKSDFSPEPEVDGGILKLARKDIGLDVRKYEGFLRKVFANPRKMLNKTFDADELNQAGLDGNMRPQNYGWENWVNAFRMLTQKE